jgi:hypothetical protein
MHTHTPLSAYQNTLAKLASEDNILPPSKRAQRVSSLPRPHTIDCTTAPHESTVIVPYVRLPNQPATMTTDSPNLANYVPPNRNTIPTNPNQQPTHTRSLHQGYYDRATIPKAYELARTQPFGKPNTSMTQCFTSEAAFPHIVPLLFSVGLDIDLRNQIFAAYPPSQRLWIETNRTHNLDITTLQSPRPDFQYESQTEIDPDRVDLHLAALIHFNFDVAALVRFIGGNHVAAHRDADKILHHIRDIIDPELYADVEHALRLGAPHYINAEGSWLQFQKYWEHGNHKSVTKNVDLFHKAMNKEDRKDHIITFPRWVGPFIQHFMITPNGLISKEGKKDRIIFDASYQLDIDSIPWNHCVTKETEPEIIFGGAFLRHLTEIYNYRISFPESDILLHDDDVAACFRSQKYNPEVVSSKGIVWGDYCGVWTGLTFGDVSSPSNWEPIARARATLATHYVKNARKEDIPLYEDYLVPVKFSAPAPPNTVFSQAYPDAINTGVYDAQGNIRPTKFNTHVDDNMYADITPQRMRWAMRCSIQALNVMLGFPDLPRRQNAVDHEKFLRETVGYLRIQIGFEINTRDLVVALPTQKEAATYKLLQSTWGKHRRQFNLREAADLCGNMAHNCRICPWGKYHVIALYDALRRALDSAKRKILHSPAHAKFLEHYIETGSPPAPTKESKWFGKERAKLIWNSKEKIHITKEMRFTLDFLARIFQNPRANHWIAPIASLIPRANTYDQKNDACGFGGGGFCKELKMYWYLPWPAAWLEHICTNRAVADRLKDGIYINLLELVAIVLGLAGMICAWEQLLPVPVRCTTPRVLIWTDNTSADSWAKKASRIRNPRNQQVARILGHLLQFTPGWVLDTKHIPGKDNDIADYLSRLERIDTTTHLVYADDHPHLAPDVQQALSLMQTNSLRFHPSPELLSHLTSILLSRASTLPTTRIKLGHMSPGVITI